MRKILVMIPAGEVYDHDCVRWYKAHDTQRCIDQYHNIGDAFVHDSSLKLLDYDQVSVLRSARPTRRTSTGTTPNTTTASCADRIT